MLHNIRIEEFCNGLNARRVCLETRDLHFSLRRRQVLNIFRFVL